MNLTASLIAESSSLSTPATLSSADLTAATMSWKASFPSSIPMTLSAAIMSPARSPATVSSLKSPSGAAFRLREVLIRLLGCLLMIIYRE